MIFRVCFSSALAFLSYWSLNVEECLVPLCIMQIFDWCKFQQQLSILIQARVWNHEQPCLATWTHLQTAGSQLNCHSDFVSESVSSKAWISNSDWAATNQTVSVRLLKRKLQAGIRCKVSCLDFPSQRRVWKELMTLRKEQTTCKGLFYPLNMVQWFILLLNDWENDWGLGWWGV